MNAAAILEDALQRGRRYYSIDVLEDALQHASYTEGTRENILATEVFALRAEAVLRDAPPPAPTETPLPMPPRRRVMIESPYAGDRERNLAYLRKAIRNSSLDFGEAPFASHRMYTDALDDDRPDERAAGIGGGFAWWSVAELVVFYIDLGWSPGMEAALERCRALGMPYVFRSFGRAP